MKDKDTFDMLLKDRRLKTFKKWPYGDDSKLNKQAVWKCDIIVFVGCQVHS